MNVSRVPPFCGLQPDLEPSRSPAGHGGVRAVCPGGLPAPCVDEPPGPLQLDEGAARAVPGDDLRSGTRPPGGRRTSSRVAHPARRLPRVDQELPHVSGRRGDLQLALDRSGRQSASHASPSPLVRLPVSVPRGGRARARPGRPATRQALGSRLVQTPRPVAPFAHQPGLLQEGQVLRDRRQRHLEMRRDLPGRALPSRTRGRIARRRGAAIALSAASMGVYVSRYLRKCQLTNLAVSESREVVDEERPHQPRARAGDRP